jgi:hypothetical protein
MATYYFGFHESKEEGGSAGLKRCGTVSQCGITGLTVERAAAEPADRLLGQHDKTPSLIHIGRQDFCDAGSGEGCG